MKKQFQSNGTSRMPRVWQLLMTMVFLFTLGIGQMWGTDYGPFTITANTSTENPIYGIASDDYVGGNGVQTFTIPKVGSTASKSASSNMTYMGATSGSYQYIKISSGTHFYIRTTAPTYIKSVSIMAARNSTSGQTNGFSYKFKSAESYSTQDMLGYNNASVPSTPVSAVAAGNETEFDLYSSSKEWIILSISVTLTAGGTTTTYDVTLNPGDGAYASAPSGWTADGSNIKKTVSAGALTIPEPTRAGYKLTGWKSGLTDVTLSAGKLSVTQDTTLTAQWAEADCKIYSLTGAIGSAEVTAGDGSVSASALVLSNSAARIKLTPASGETFKAGDVITISGVPGNTAKKFSVYVYAANGSTKLATLTVTNAGDLPLLSGTLSGDAEYVFLARIDGTTQNIYTCEIHRSCAAGEAAGLSYATASVEKTTGDAAFTNPLTNTNGLYVAGYSSSNTAVATVASNGAVTIVGDGSATITAHSAVQTKAGALYAAGTATYTVTVTSADDDATLSALSVSGLTLSPAFAAATEDYTVTKEYGAADPVVGNVTATPTSGTASAAVVWDSENHKFVITVTAGDNTTKKTYTITVNQAPAPKSLSRVLFSNGFDAFIDNANHTVKAYYLAGQAAPTATTITAGDGTPGGYAEGKITVTGADDSTVDYTVTLEAVTPNTTAVAEEAAAGEFAGDEAWVKNGLLVYGNPAGYDGTNKRYTNRRLTKGTDPEDDQRVIAGWVRSYFFVGNASKFIMTIGGNKNLDYTIDGGTPVENVNVETLEIALTKGNHMIEIVSHQQSGDCYMSAPKLVELPPTYTVTYMPGDGEGAWVVDEEALVVADCPNTFTAPEGKIFHGWKDGDNNDVAVGDPVTASMALTAQWIAHYAVTFNMQDHGTAIVAQDIVHGSKAVKPADPFEIGYDFSGWYTEAACTNAFDFNTPITAATELFAKWTAFDGCTLFYPATSGSAIAVGDAINKQIGSFGATMVAVSKDDGCTLAYDSYGLSFASSGNTSRVKVTLDHEIAIGTKITVTLVANGDKGSNRALDLYNSAVAKKAMLGWTSSDDYLKYDVATFSHVVTADDAMAGTNEFYLYRNNSVYLQCLKVESCGAAIVYHNVTSEVNIAGKGTVALGASSVREGYTTTAEYTITDPLYEFVSWEVSGEGATLSSTTANPVTVTVGTADAVVTLNLKLIPVKFTVNYYDGSTLKGSEEVEVNEHPTASEINTNKRHFTFQGWSDTDGGDVVALNTITSAVAATINLYAVYAPVACPTEGTVFSMEFDNTKTPTSTVKVAKNGGSLDLADYATLVGGNAVIENTETSDKDAISTDGKFKLTATKEVMKIELECAIATGDVIRIPDNNAKYVLSTSNAKTGTYQAQTSSQHEFEATAAWNGVDDLYILYDGSSLNFAKVYVLRPYTISFDLQGHGDAIDVQKLVEGKKIVAPTAPTADGWDFGGWYKEAACTNAWDFDNDVVDGTMSLFAKWSEHVTNDATLKSLKYGNTAITLEDGIYTYPVELAAAVTAVPALSAETNADLATKSISNAAAFDEEGHATSTVLVTAEDGMTQLTYTVNFTKAAAIDPANVTGSRTWDWSTAGMGEVALENGSVEYLMANVSSAVPNTEAFRSDMLFLTGNYANRGSSNKFFQGWQIRFYTEVPGRLTLTARAIHGKMSLTVNDSTLTGLGETMKAHAPFIVPAGWVTITMTNEATSGSYVGEACRLQKIVFDATPDHERDVVVGNMGTVCLPNPSRAFGVKVYELAGKGEGCKVQFDELAENEVLAAGKAYVLVMTDTKAKFFYTNTETPATVADSETAMKGNLGETITFQKYEEAARNVVFFKDNAMWNAYETGLKVGQYRAYLQYDEVGATTSAPAPGRRRISLDLQGQNAATGMDELNASDAPVKVLIDGQIYIIRGEKMFDATGRMVK